MIMQRPSDRDARLVNIANQTAQALRETQADLETAHQTLADFTNMARELQADKALLSAELSLAKEFLPHICGICWTMSYAPCDPDDLDAEPDPKSTQGGFMACQYCALYKREDHFRKQVIALQAERDALQDALSLVVRRESVDRETGTRLVQTSNSRKPMEAGQV